MLVKIFETSVFLAICSFLAVPILNKLMHTVPEILKIIIPATLYISIFVFFITSILLIWCK